MRRRGHSDSGSGHAAEYHPLTAVGDGEFEDQQFEEGRVRRPFPGKSICLAALLCLTGAGLLVVGSLLVSGYLNPRYADRTWPVLLLGAIMFIPGAYHVRVAYFAYCGVTGYTYDDIPSFD